MADVFSTTFDHPEWLQDAVTGAWTIPSEATSENISSGLTTLTFPSNPNGVTTAANHSGGVGGRGLRQWLGDGTAQGNGNVNFGFGSDQPELWVRAYVRYEQGFKIIGSFNHKVLYMKPSQGPYLALGFYNGKFGAQSSSSNLVETLRWEDIFGGFGGETLESQGNWHCLEWYMKMDTGAGDGLFMCWYDGDINDITANRIVNRTDVSYGNGAGWSFMHPSNFSTPDNVAGSLGREPAYMDMDDVVASNSGRIGPIVAASSGVSVGNFSLR